MTFDSLNFVIYFLAAMGKTSAERMKALRLRHKEADPEFMKKENERISLLQKRQRASMNEEELTAAREYN